MPGPSATTPPTKALRDVAAADKRFATYLPVIVSTMPRVKPDDVELIDGDVARSFFYSEMYYQALQVEMEKDFAAFRKTIEE